MKSRHKLSITLIIFFISSCEPTERLKEFRNSSISGIVDSTIYYKFEFFDPKTHFFLVDNKWYEVYAGKYGIFFNYLDKGDSVFKKPGRWDIYVYKKTNGKYKEKYFRGAQDDWK